MSDGGDQILPYELIGGEAVLRRVVDRFYDIMDTDPRAATIRAMHAGDLGPMREKLFDFLSGWLGGPPLYFKRADRACMGTVHSAYAIGSAEIEQWMMCMRQALADENVAEETRSLIDRPLSMMCEMMRNRD